MLWLLAYLIVGIAYISFGMQPALRKMLKEEEDDVITIVVMFLVICIFTPVWQALVTMKTASKCHKMKEIEK